MVGDAQPTLAARRGAQGRVWRLYPLLFAVALLLLFGSFCVGFVESLRIFGLPPIESDATVLGRALVERGDYAGAVEEFRLAAAIDPERYDPPPELALAVPAGVDSQALVQRRRRELAERPQEAAAHLALGRALLHQGDAAGALGSLERARELDPRLSGLHEALGLALYQLGRLEEAARAFRGEHDPEASRQREIP